MKKIFVLALSVVMIASACASKRVMKNCVMIGQLSGGQTLSECENQ